jgi:cytosine/uracil/thiamine/allantoin permease
MQRAMDHSDEAQRELWRRATTAAQQDPTPITALFIASLNEAFDLKDKRVATLEHRIPGSIWFMLVFIALLTCLTVGYSQRRRLLTSMGVPPLAIALVMMLIADLDSSRAGLIRVRQQSIERLQSEGK